MGQMEEGRPDSRRHCAGSRSSHRAAEVPLPNPGEELGLGVYY